MKKVKKIPYEILLQKKWGIRQHLRRISSGCLEYIHPKNGRVANPLIGIGGGETTGSLRKWILEKHIGRLKKGIHPFMACGNRYCLEYDHMTTINYMPRYGPARNEYVLRYTPLQIHTVLYFKNKISQGVLSKVIGLKSEAVYKIWGAENRREEYRLPAGWHPSKQVINQMEKAAIEQYKIYLGPESLEQARSDIARSALPQKSKQIIARLISGESTKGLSGELNITMTGAMYVYRRALVKLYKETGFRSWMKLASKGIISK